MADRHRDCVERRALGFDDLSAGGLDELLDGLILRFTLPGNALAVRRRILVDVHVVVRDVHQRPGHERRIAVLAIDVRVHILRTDEKALGKRGLEAAGVKNRAGADDLVLGKPGNFVEHVGQHVHGIRNEDIDGLRRDTHNLRGDVLEDVDVHLRKLQPGLAGLSRKAGGDDHDVGVCRRLIVARTDDGGRTERRALIDVQRLTERLLLVDVDQHDLGSRTLNHQVVGNGRADAARANHSNLTHNRSRPF